MEAASRPQARTAHAPDERDADRARAQGSAIVRVQGSVAAPPAPRQTPAGGEGTRAVQVDARGAAKRAGRAAACASAHDEQLSLAEGDKNPSDRPVEFLRERFGARQSVRRLDVTLTRDRAATRSFAFLARADRRARDQPVAPSPTRWVSRQASARRQPVGCRRALTWRHMHRRFNPPADGIVARTGYLRSRRGTRARAGRGTCARDGVPAAAAHGRWRGTVRRAPDWAPCAGTARRTATGYLASRRRGTQPRGLSCAGLMVERR